MVVVGARMDVIVRRKALFDGLYVAWVGRVFQGYSVPLLHGDPLVVLNSAYRRLTQIFRILFRLIKV